MGVWSVARSDVRGGVTDSPIIGFVIVTLLVTQMCLGIEYRLLASLSGCSVTFLTATRVSLSGSLANLLPVPGSLAVRIAHLRARGASAAQITRSTLAVATVSLGAAATVVVPFISGPARVVCGCTAVFLMGCSWILTRHQGLSTFGSLIALQFVLLATDAVRIALVAAVLGIDLGPTGAILMTLAPVLSTAIGVAPAGLGLREGFSAALSSAAGLGASSAVTLSVIDTAVRSIMLGLCAAALGMIRADTTTADQAPEHSVAA